jgi:hypothetical protein
VDFSSFAAEGAPGYRDRAALADIGRRCWIEQCQCAAQHSAMHVREKHSNASAERGELIALRAGTPFNEAFALEAPEVISGLPAGVAAIKQTGGALRLGCAWRRELDRAPADLDTEPGLDHVWADQRGAARIAEHGQRTVRQRNVLAVVEHP